MVPLLKYSNGWGHLIMSVSTQIVAVILLLQRDPALVGVAVSLLASVSGYWYISSAAHSQQKIIEAQAKNQTQVTVTSPPPPPITVTGGLSDGKSHS